MNQHRRTPHRLRGVLERAGRLGGGQRGGKDQSGGAKQHAVGDATDHGAAALVLPAVASRDVALEEDEGDEAKEEKHGGASEDGDEGAGLEVEGCLDHVGDVVSVGGGVAVGVGRVARQLGKKVGGEGLDGAARGGLAAGAVLIDAANTEVADADLDRGIGGVVVRSQGNDVDVGDRWRGGDASRQGQRVENDDRENQDIGGVTSEARSCYLVSQNS